MKVTREKAAEHRAAMVRAASRLFRKRGFEDVAVTEITKAAGLTHGGFYGHFASKDALAAETCQTDFERSISRLATYEGRDGFLAYVDNYLSDQHRDRADGGCPMAAYVVDVPRQKRAIQARFSAGIGRFIDTIADRLRSPRGARAQKQRDRAIVILSAMVGGLALARAARSDPDQSAEILKALRKELEGLIKRG